jgi:hypothetical protein
MSDLSLEDRKLDLESKIELSESESERRELLTDLAGVVAEIAAQGAVEGAVAAVDPREVEVSRPDGMALVVRQDVPEDVFRAMDALDEGQILDALQGRPSEVMVYSFRSGGKLQTGLSYAGVCECVREMNVSGFARIRVSPDVKPVVEEYQEEDQQGALVTYFRVTVYAEDLKNGGGQYGMASQRKFQSFRDKARKPELDSFALTKALSKAQRNAMLPLVPVEFREVVIAQALKDEARVRQIRAGEVGDLAELPPPLTDERAEAQRETCRELFRQLQKVNRLAVLPAQHHVYLSRAEHSHERLGEYIAYLEQKVSEETAKAVVEGAG